MTSGPAGDFLLEVLLEEMPAGAIPGARADLARKFLDALAEAAIPAQSVDATATPRRLVVVVRGLPLRQEDRIVDVTGPPVERAFDAGGQPTKMAEGFARAQGVSVAELGRARTPKGEVLLARKTIAGRPTGEILAEITPGILASMTFPQKLKAAMKGTREHRAILIRDPNKLICATVLASPKVSVPEVESFARMQNVSEDVLRIIGSNRSWLKSYGVVLALTKNPKTPLALSMQLMTRLQTKDLAKLSVDRNVPEALRISSRKKVVANQSGKD